MYLYETHLHTKNASACAHHTPSELVHAFKRVGYSGFVITDQLLYGIDLDFLLNHPEIEKASIDELADLVHEVGGLIIHAHPHRDRAYIDPDFAPRYDVCDGIEVFNAGDPKIVNDAAYEDAITYHKLMTSGGGVHLLDRDERITRAGLAFERRLKDINDFVNAVKNREGWVIIDGEKCPLE